MSKKDLFILAADADAVAVLKEVLKQPKSLNIKSITFTPDRHPNHDSGMVTDGPELVRRKIKKAHYSKVLLLWDHNGSGWENELDPSGSQERINNRLIQVTWKENSAAIAVCPELEGWLWHDPRAIRKFLRFSEQDFNLHIGRYASKQKLKAADVIFNEPKELLRHLFYLRLKRSRVLPAEFAKITKESNLSAWRQSASFNALIEILQKWFPAK